MIIVAILALMGLLALAARFWRIATWAAFVLMIYEGAFRKWVFPQFHQYIYFLKDAVLLGAYFGCYFGSRLMRGRRVIPAHIANAAIVLWAAIAMLQVFNPRSPNLATGLYGLQSYLFYVPLMYLAPELLPDRKSFDKFVAGLLLVSAIPLALGIVQFNMPRDHAINQYVWSDQEIASFGAGGDHARVTSTFSYITGYSLFVATLAGILLALALVERRRRWRIALYVSLGATLANAFMTGSRATMVHIIITAPLVVVLTIGAATKRHVKRALALTLIIPTLVFAVAYIFPDAQAALVGRVADNSEEGLRRVKDIFAVPGAVASEAGVRGWGIGITLPGSSFLHGGIIEDAPPYAEGEMERVLVETGIFGLIALVLVRILVACQLYAAIRKFPRSPARPIVAAALTSAIISVPLQLIVSRTAGMNYWFLAGFAYLPAVWAASEAKAAAQVAAETGTSLRTLEGSLT